jgi:hypothetical protein
LHLALRVENDLFKIISALLAMKLKNRHPQTPFDYYNKWGRESNGNSMDPMAIRMEAICGQLAAFSKR